MTTGVETATPSTRVTAAARTMMGHHLSWMPVCDETGHVAGVVAVVDHLRFRTDERIADARVTPMF